MGLLARLEWLGPVCSVTSCSVKILLDSPRRLKHFAQELFAINSGLRRSIGYMPEADALIPGMHGAEYVALAGELYGYAQASGSTARSRGADLFRDGGSSLSPAGRVFHRHEAADKAGPGSGARSAGSIARRANQRPGSSRPRGDAGALDDAGARSCKSIILSTHLLGDVERVCERVIILHQGNILLPGPGSRTLFTAAGPLPFYSAGENRRFLAELRLEGA